MTDRRGQNRMVREITWPVWLIIISLFIVLIGIIGIGAKTLSATNKDEPTVQISSEEIEDGIRLQTETKEADSFTSFVTYPFTESEKIDTTIKSWIDQEEELFHEKLNEADVEDAHLNVQTNITKVSKHIFSFDMLVEHFLGQETVYEKAKTYMIDQENEKFIQLSEIIKQEALKEDFLYIIIKKKLGKIDKKYSQSFKKEQIEKLNWFIQNQQISFYFNPKQLGENKEIIQIDIPIADIHHYLDSTYKDKIITKKIAEEIEKKKKKAQKPKKLNAKGKYIALTFDDGPHEKVTPRILASLKEYDAKATFFMLAPKVEYNPELALQVADEGHEIANHTNTHVNLNAVKGKRIKQEVQNSQHRIEKAIGIKPTTFRPPYGEYNQTVIKYAIESDQQVILWSIDTLDWKNRNAKSIYNIVKQQARPNSIILFHDIHEPTADALPKVLKFLSDQGYEFVTVSELLPLIEARETGLYFGN